MAKAKPGESYGYQPEVDRITQICAGYWGPRVTHVLDRIAAGKQVDADDHAAAHSESEESAARISAAIQQEEAAAAAAQNITTRPTKGTPV